MLLALQNIVKGDFFDNMPIGRESIVVDCDVTPYIPDGWSVVEHTPRGQIEFAPGKIQLYLTDSQRQGLQPQGRGLVVRTDGEVHDERLPAGLPAGEQGAHSLDLEGGGRYVYFPATKYRDSDGALCLRCLYWNDGQWNWNYNWLDNHWDDQNPAAILASLFISHSAYRRGRFVF